MNDIRRSFKQVLADKAGISVSIPELLVSISVRTIVITTVIAAVAAMLIVYATTSASTSASASLQASALLFKSDVAAADYVRGNGTDAVALFRTTSDGKCAVKVWRTTTVDDKRTLVVDNSTDADVCSTATTTPVAHAAGRQIMVKDVGLSVIKFQNVAGRTITFDESEKPTLSAGTKGPDDFDQDWADTRPQRVTLTTTSATKNLTSSSKGEIFTGTTSILSYSASAANPHEVAPVGPPPVQGVQVKNVMITRSTTTGTLYSGAREGVQVAFDGGACVDSSTSVTVSYAPTSPAGVSAVSTTFSKVLTATTAVQLAGIPNGADGKFTVSASCAGIATPATDSATYTQPVPAPVVTVSAGPDSDEQHLVTWPAVSSLASSFPISWNTDSGVNTAGASVVSALSFKNTMASGSAYGFTTTYTVLARVGSTVSPAGTGSYLTPWAPAPKASTVKYVSNDPSNAVLTDPIPGKVSWVSGACPPGTTRWTREITNRRYDLETTWSVTSATKVASYGSYTVGDWAANKNEAAWNPSYAKQGWTYALSIESECISDSTKAESPVMATQGGNFTLGIAQPIRAVYDMKNLRTDAQPTNKVAQTCRKHGGIVCTAKWDGNSTVSSLQLIYTTACPTSTLVGNSIVDSASWTDDKFINAFRDKDGWELPDNDTSKSAYYEDARYICSTPFADSGWSSDSARETMVVTPRTASN